MGDNRNILPGAIPDGGGGKDGDKRFDKLSPGRRHMLSAPRPCATRSLFIVRTRDSRKNTQTPNPYFSIFLFTNKMNISRTRFVFHTTHGPRRIIAWTCSGIINGRILRKHRHLAVKSHSLLRSFEPK